MVQKIEKLCECCGKRPVGAGKVKYCKECSKHKHAIYSARKDGRDFKTLWFVTERYCEICGEVKLEHQQHRFCKKCGDIQRDKHNAYFRDLDLRRLDRGEDMPICKRCGKHPRLIGRSLCRECTNETKRYYRARAKGLDHWEPAIKKPKKTLCKLCGVNERYKNKIRTLSYCFECFKEYRAMREAIGKSPWEIKPVENPEAYYTPASGYLDCPICNAEFCISGLPVGRRCQEKIIHHGKGYRVWRRILELKGIRVPDVNEILPEKCTPRNTCRKCGVKPVTGNAVFCEDCAKEMQELRVKEYLETKREVAYVNG